LSEALLYLLREDTGLVANPRGEVCLDKLVREIGEHMRVVAAERRQDLMIDASSPCFVLGNPEQLRRLLFNLLDNAIKFTPVGGSIDISVSCQNDEARVVVSDTGIGIAPEHLPHIFDRFYRADSARSRQTEGNGLGLSICRSIAEAHGASLEVESTVGEGTQFALRMPGTVPEPDRVTELEAVAARGEESS
jgi:signal transduction histidine kinase